MFNAMDPAPFRERDLDPAAEAYIVDWAEEQRPRDALSLVVHLGRGAGAASAPPASAASPPVPDAGALGDAVHAYFTERAAAARRSLKRLFRDGRISLAIGVTFLAVAIVAGEVVASFASKESYASIVKESFVIGGWVALWRPMEIFFYDWWPIRREAKLYDRLGAMDVRIQDAAPLPGARP